MVAQLGQDNKTQMKTPTIDNGGPDVLFDFLDFKVVVTAASLQSVIFEIFILLRCLCQVLLNKLKAMLK